MKDDKNKQNNDDIQLEDEETTAPGMKVRLMRLKILLTLTMKAKKLAL